MKKRYRYQISKNEKRYLRKMKVVAQWGKNTHTQTDFETAKPGKYRKHVLRYGSAPNRKRWPPCLRQFYTIILPFPRNKTSAALSQRRKSSYTDKRVCVCVGGRASNSRRGQRLGTMF